MLVDLRVCTVESLIDTARIFVLVVSWTSSSRFLLFCQMIAEGLVMLLTQIDVWGVWGAAAAKVVL
jgi:hypothetical protein